MEPRSLESREVEEMPGRLIATWAPSVQNRLGPAIDTSSWNNDEGDYNDDHKEEGEEDIDGLENLTLKLLFTN